jgi:hypothetical protein
MLDSSWWWNGILNGSSLMTNSQSKPTIWKSDKQPGMYANPLLAKIGLNLK